MAKQADALIRSNFEAFTRKCFSNTTGKLLGKQPYVSFLCSEVAALDRGDMTRLIINLPPRHLKSFVCTVCQAAWRLAHRPSSRILLVTYTEQLASQLAREVQKIIRLPWFQKLFEARIARNHSSVTDFATSQGGQLRAVSVSGSVTGFGADLLIFDDPLNIRDADNESQITLINETFYPVLMSRLNNPASDQVVIVAHRLNENDLTGFLMEEGGWDQVVLPFCAEEESVHGTWHRGAGELLRPDAIPTRILRGSRQALTIPRCTSSA